jgi:integrase
MSSIDLPSHVHKVKAGGREYFYYQANRGTAEEGDRIRLPDDPRTPEWWEAVRQAQGVCGPVPTDTVGALIDAYQAAWPSLQKKLAVGTQDQYRRYLKTIRAAWGDLPAASTQPKHVDALVRKIGATKPGAANNVLSSFRAMCGWARGPVGLLSHDPAHGVKAYEPGEGHKPWTHAQLAYASENFTGMLRRWYFLARYTGQRESDCVRLCPEHEDDGGFTLRQRKSGAVPWCPIFPELEAEMETWSVRDGPYLIQETGRNAGKPFTPNGIWKLYDAERKKHPILEGAVPHGLRANAVIRLRTHGFTAEQISDMVGMSVEMVEHYSRHADRKASGKAVLRGMKSRAEVPIVKALENGKVEL